MKRVLSLAACLLLMWAITVHAGGLNARAVPSTGVVQVGQWVTVAIELDTAGSLVGSYTASLRWNPQVLSFRGSSSAPADFVGVVNSLNAASGYIRLNGANPNGATGEVTILTVTFQAVGAGASVLDLEFSALAEARTFANLLPLLSVADNRIAVTRPIWRR